MKLFYSWVAVYLFKCKDQAAHIQVVAMRILAHMQLLYCQAG